MSPKDEFGCYGESRSQEGLGHPSATQLIASLQGAGVRTISARKQHFEAGLAGGAKLNELGPAFASEDKI